MYIIEQYYGSDCGELISVLRFDEECVNDGVQRVKIPGFIQVMEDLSQNEDYYTHKLAKNERKVIE